MEERMQKFVNRPEDMVAEDISGFVKCYPGLVKNSGADVVLSYKHAPVPGKVGIVTGGGSGHDPAFTGYIGKNLVDAVAVGTIFVPPPPEVFYEAFRQADSGSGVACLCGNYTADLNSIEQAVKMAEADGIKVKTVIAMDDVSTMEADKRRGLSGEIFMWKIGGAAAAAGYSLDAVAAVAHKAISNTRSMGVGLSSCILPIEGRPNYLIEAGTMEIGVGHHGMASLDTCKLKTANEAVEIMLRKILEDMPLKRGDRTAVLISGLGNTMLMELHILFGRAYDILKDIGVEVLWSRAGNYFTSLDMMGATISVMRLDDELLKLLETPCDSAALKQL